MLFRFPVVKILDYATQWNALETSTNPFAIVVQVHLKTLETRRDEQSRLRWKITLTKALYQRGFNKADILRLYRCIDWFMRLPDDLERACFQEISAFEEGYRMPYITSAERFGIEKGMQQGLQQGLRQGEEKGKFIGEILLSQRILKLGVYQEAELKVKTLEELRTLAQELEAKLTL